MLRNPGVSIVDQPLVIDVDLHPILGAVYGFQFGDIQLYHSHVLHQAEEDRGNDPHTLTRGAIGIQSRVWSYQSYLPS